MSIRSLYNYYLYYIYLEKKDLYKNPEKSVLLVLCFHYASHDNSSDAM